MTKVTRFFALVMAVAVLLCSFTIGAFAKKDPLNYLLLGDSIAFGSGLRNPDEACYGRIVADTNGYDYENLAIPGSTTANLINRLNESSVRESVSDADIISISIGGNNFLLNNLPLLILEVIFRNYSRLDKTVDNFYTDFTSIMSTIKSLNPDALIIVQTLYNPMPGIVRQYFQQGIDRLNNAYAKYLKAHPGSCVIADVEKSIGDDCEMIALDFIHPSAKGNVAIARLLLQTLKDEGLGEATEPVVNVAGEDTFGKLLRGVVIGVMKIF